MTASTTEQPQRRTVVLAVTDADRRIAHYAMLAIMLSVAEAALPSPLPGVKPGLANIVILLVLLRHGWRDAAWVSLLRVVAGSLLTGQLLAPGFFLALTGAGVSLVALALAMRLPPSWFGPTTLSIVAAFAHVAGQLLLARIWLVPHDGVFYLAPVFAASALIFGIVNGLIVAKLLKEKL